MIIMLTGTPGTGKTAIGGIMAEDLGCTLLSSSRLLRAAGGTHPDPTGRYTEVIDESILARIAADLAESSSKGSCIILETVYPDLWLDIEEFYSETALIVLLRCNPLELESRLRRRGWPRGKIIENVVAEALNELAEVLLPWSHSTIELDTTGLDPKQAYDRLLDSIYSWNTGIRIDWTLDPKIAERLPRLMTEASYYLDKYRLGV